MKDLYRGDGGPLSSYDEGWNDGIEAAEKAIRAEKAEAELAAIKAAQPSGYIIEEVSSGGYSVGGAGGSGPSAISDETGFDIDKEPASLQDFARRMWNEALTEAERPIGSEATFWGDTDDTRAYKACMRMLEAVRALKLPEEP